MGKDKSAKRNTKPGKLKDLPAKSTRADRAASIRGGIVWGRTRVVPVRTGS